MGLGYRAAVDLRRAGFIAALLTALLAIACDSSQVAAQELQRRTVPNGAIATGLSGPRRTPNGVPFTWDVRSSLSWDEYRGRMIVEFERDFRVVRRDGSSLLLSRRANGDAYRLEIQAAPATAGTEVHRNDVGSPARFTTTSVSGSPS